MSDIIDLICYTTDFIQKIQLIEEHFIFQKFSFIAVDKFTILQWMQVIVFV